MMNFKKTRSYVFLAVMLVSTLSLSSCAWLEEMWRNATAGSNNSFASQDEASDAAQQNAIDAAQDDMVDSSSKSVQDAVSGGVSVEGYTPPPE